MTVFSRKASASIHPFARLRGLRRDVDGDVRQAHIQRQTGLAEAFEGRSGVGGQRPVMLAAVRDVLRFSGSART